ncbi:MULTISPECIES: helix-turn-helix domain-containing protein [Rhodococcus]|uniref:helix-turn-helix domain-containing protein n=1 Tax=Rhodococcus sp. KB6 TaxID=1752066 RepID=UPI0007182713
MTILATGKGAELSEATFMTVRELADRWVVSERRIRELAAAGDVPAMKLGKLWRFPVARIQMFEKANSGSAVRA